MEGRLQISFLRWRPTFAAIWTLSVGFSMFATSSAICAEVFASVGADGAVRYASQAVDESYHLAWTDSPPAAPLQRWQSPSHRSISPQWGRLQSVIREVAARHALAPSLLEAIIAIESGYNTHAISRVGARGPMQLMPATAAQYGLKDQNALHSPAQNIDAGARHFKALLSRHSGNVALALAAYNSGEGTVARHGARIPPFPETMVYVAAVLARAASAQPQ